VSWVGKSIVCVCVCVTRAPSAYPKRRTAKTVQIRQLHKWKSPVKFKQNVTGFDLTAVDYWQYRVLSSRARGPGVGTVTASGEYENTFLISRSAVTILQDVSAREKKREPSKFAGEQRDGFYNTDCVLSFVIGVPLTQACRIVIIEWYRNTLSGYAVRVCSRRPESGNSGSSTNKNRRAITYAAAAATDVRSPAVCAGRDANTDWMDGRVPTHLKSERDWRRVGGRTDVVLGSRFSTATPVQTFARAPTPRAIGTTGYYCCYVICANCRGNWQWYSSATHRAYRVYGWRACFARARRRWWSVFGALHRYVLDGFVRLNKSTFRPKATVT